VREIIALCVVRYVGGMFEKLTGFLRFLDDYKSSIFTMSANHLR
jgi:hypothetical protein